MAKGTRQSGASDAEAGKADLGQQDICGIVMPISATTTVHDEAHWARVQTLLHRAVRGAGIEPKNVWVGQATDRITERILSNLFEVPIALCDITDLNPNVMLELGMRLTSKRPTIVVMEQGPRPPFVIGDFEAITYPPDLNILDMEDFFEVLKNNLREKLAAWKAGDYKPFLRNITIDVLEPEARQVPFEELVTQQLEAISARLERVDARSQAAALPPQRSGLMFSEGRGIASIEPGKFRIAVEPDGDVEKINDLLAAHPSVDRFTYRPGLLGSNFDGALVERTPFPMMMELQNIIASYKGKIVFGS